MNDVSASDFGVDPAEDVADAAGVKCSVCGLNHRASSDAALAIVSTQDLEGMCRFLDGHLDAADCERCGSKLELLPALVILGEDWLEASDGGLMSASAALGALGNAESAERVQRTAGAMEALKEAVAGRLARLLPVVEALLACDDSQGRLVLLAERWSEITPELIVATDLAHAGLIQGPIAERIGMATQAALESALGEAQGIALLHLWQRLSEEDGRSLEKELRRYIAQGLVFEAATELIAGVHREPSVPVAPIDTYALLAVHASASRASGVDNPLLAAWASNFTAFSLALAEQPDELQLQRMVIDSDRAHATLEFGALWDVAAEMFREDGQLPERLAPIYEDAGFPTVIPQFLTEGIAIPVDSGTSATKLTEFLDSVFAQDETLGMLAEAQRRLLAASVRAGRADLVEPLTDHALGLADGSPDARAILEGHLGGALKDLRMPRRFFDRVGEQPAEWEREASSGARATLWTERSNAWRLLGRPEKARELVAAIYESAEGEEHQRVAEMNMAILLRETGEIDRAARMLAELAPRCPEGQRISVMESLVATYGILGRGRDALDVAGEALALAGGPWSSQQSRLRASVAHLQAAVGEHDACLDSLALLERSDDDAESLLLEAAAWAALAEQKARGLDSAKLGRIAEELFDCADAASQQGNRIIELNALRVLAVLLEALEHPDAERIWRQQVELRKVLGRLDPLELATVARYSWRAGDLEEGRALMRAVPNALTFEIGGMLDLAAGLQVTGRLGVALRRLADVVIDSEAAEIADIRLLAELQRDATGRARMLRSTLDDVSVPAGLAEGVSDERLARLAPKFGSLHVVEWFEAGERLLGLLTQINDGGEVTSRFLNAPRSRIDQVALRLRARLDGWRPGRTGDPLDYAPWLEVERWLGNELAEVEDGDHVVFIDHVGHAGLPWHSVRGPTNWTSSYAPSWSAILALPALPAELPSDGLIGVLSVPALGDTDTTTNAFSESVSRSLSDAEESRWSIRTLLDQEADGGRLMELLGAADMIKLQCHGYVDPGAGEMALMLADRGRLPSQHAVIAASLAGEPHVFSWREAQSIDAAPSVIFSAACSTGASLIGGLGERLGLYGALRLSGTRSVVAPAWDAVATDVLPIVDEVIRSYLAGAGSLAHCVRDAALNAELQLPRWRAWSLALEGDWR